MSSANEFEESIPYTLDTPDMDFWPVDVEIESVHVQDGDLVVHWADNRTSIFLALWLREQCPCRECHSEVTRETLIDITDIPIDIQAAEVTLEDTGYLKVTWSGGVHASRFHPGWLRANSYEDWSRAERRQAQARPTWDHTFSLPEFDGLQVLKSDDCLYEWLVALDRYGLALLRNVPVKHGMVGEIARRIGLIRQSNFGTVFDVVSKPDANSNAYLSVELPLHMDLPTREMPPGLQFLHCHVNEAKGGDSRFADAFHLARLLKDEAPAVYETITTVEYSFRNRSLTCDYRASGPLIRLDAAGNPVEHRINTFLTAPITHLPQHQLKKALEAKHYLLHMLNEERFRVQFKMSPGDMVAFDNRRALHSRTEFFPHTGNRLLEGCYLDRDELKSALHMLERGKKRLSCGY